MAQGTQNFTPDPRNDAILIHANGALVPPDIRQHELTAGDALVAEVCSETYQYLRKFALQ
jgi:hypothetical protein